jgi:hypothetical protein
MKNLKLIPILLLIVSFVACKKDKIDAGSDTKNSLTYQNAGNPKTIKFTRASVSIKGTKNIPISFRGENNLGVTIHLVDANVFTQIPEGTFTRTSNGKTFDGAILYYGINDASYTVQGIDRQITITKVGTNYSFDFEFTSGMGLVKGNYTGSVVFE